MTSPAFDELHVISDLHIGGAPGFQIFTQGKKLAGFIDSLTNSAAKARIGLCLNGDTVDFLAEPGATYFQPGAATKHLDRMFADPAFQPVWEALQRFAAKPNRRLILTLGNHDLELALPWVREHLAGHLSAGKDEARGRLIFAFDGTGFRCLVGTANVLCLHGNEFDTFNVTDHERLRRIGRDLQQGRDVEAWTPNAGSKLVVDVMNEIKQRYAFVDLLYPLKATVAVLWALDQATATRLTGVLNVVQHASWDALRKASGFLGRGEVAGGPVPGGRPEQLPALLGKTFGARGPAAHEAEKLLDEAEKHLENNIEAISLAMEQSAQKLGWFGAAWNRLIGKPRHEQVWEALRELASHSHDPTHYDETAEIADQLAGPEIEYIVTGHTHQARQIPRRGGSGVYFNSGTWAGLVGLASAQLKSAAAFEPVFRKLASAKTVSELGGLVENRPTVVSINKDGARLWDHSQVKPKALVKA